MNEEKKKLPVTKKEIQISWEILNKEIDNILGASTITMARARSKADPRQVKILDGERGV